MLLYFTALICLLLAIIFQVIYNNNDKTTFYGEVIGPLFIVFSATFVVISTVECFSKPNVEDFNHRYTITLKKIDAYNEDTDFELLSDLFTDCKEIDSKIKKNKELCHSKWRGNGYSEEIGNIPSIVEVFKEKFD